MPCHGPEGLGRNPGDVGQRVPCPSCLLGVLVAKVYGSDKLLAYSANTLITQRVHANLHAQGTTKWLHILVFLLIVS